MLEKTEERNQLKAIILETFKLGFIRGKADNSFTLSETQEALNGSEYHNEKLTSHLFDVLVEDLPQFFGK